MGVSVAWGDVGQDKSLELDVVDLRGDTRLIDRHRSPLSWPWLSTVGAAWKYLRPDTCTEPRSWLAEAFNQIIAGAIRRRQK